MNHEIRHRVEPFRDHQREADRDRHGEKPWSNGQVRNQGVQGYQSKRSVFGFISPATSTNSSRIRRPARAKWTHEEIKEMKALAGKVSVREIASRIGRSPSSVKQKGNSLGLKMLAIGENHHSAKHSNRLVEKARRMRESGQTISSIASQLEVSEATVQNWTLFRSRLDDPVILGEL